MTSDPHLVSSLPDLSSEVRTKLWQLLVAHGATNNRRDVVLSLVDSLIEDCRQGVTDTPQTPLEVQRENAAAIQESVKKLRLSVDAADKRVRKRFYRNLIALKGSIKRSDAGKVRFEAEMGRMEAAVERSLERAEERARSSRGVKNQNRALDRLIWRLAQIWQSETGQPFAASDKVSNSLTTKVGAPRQFVKVVLDGIDVHLDANKFKHRLVVARKKLADVDSWESAESEQDAEDEDDANEHRSTPEEEHAFAQVIDEMFQSMDNENEIEIRAIEAQNKLLKDKLRENEIGIKQLREFGTRRPP